MKCVHQDTPEGIRIIRLVGRMDIEGNEAISLRFSTLVATSRTVVLDLSGLEFLSSLGISTIVMAAKNVRARDGMLVMCGAGTTVEQALTRTNIPGLIPLLPGLDEACARVTAPAGD